ncbi:MAG: ATP-binding protein [Micrococcales bacterium]|nr:ATP-binding protein [Micrococcales bacterium]
MDGQPELIRRRVLDLVPQRATEFPVVLLQGPRAVGKSTALRILAAADHAPCIDLDDPIVADDALANPSSFLPSAPRVYLDEHQRAPVLLDAIKARLNRDGRPGQFVLAGSTSVNALPAGTQALTGRLHRLPVYPLSQREVEGHEGGVLAHLFDAPESLLVARSQTERDEYVNRVVVGGYPQALRSPNEPARQRWFADYLTQTILRDLPALEAIRRPEAVRRLLSLVAASTGQIATLGSLAEGAGVQPRTAQTYLDVLEQTFIIHRLQPWTRVPTSRTFRKPKLHLVDSGLAAHLLRLTSDKMATRAPEALTAFGGLLESFVVAEILKEASWLDDTASVGYWRTHEGVEVDLIVERLDGAVVAFEIKSAQRLKDGDLAALRALRDRIGPDFRAGVVLHTGPRAANPEDRLFTLPIDQLWSP